MTKPMDKNLGELHYLTSVWLEEFAQSQHFELLTEGQRVGFEKIIAMFIDTMYHKHDRMPKKWTQQTTLHCCLESLPENEAWHDSFFLIMPHVLSAFFGFLAESGYIKNGVGLIRAMKRLMEYSYYPAEPVVAVGLVNPFEDLLASNQANEQISQTLRTFSLQLAKKIANDHSALISDSLSQSLEREPVLVVEILHLLIEEFSSSAPPDDFLITAYFLMLSHALQNIRFGMDRHFDWAIALDRKFQLMVADYANNEVLPTQLLVGVLEALAEVKLTIAPELLAAYEYQITHLAPQMDAPNREQIDAMFESLVEEHQGDPFALSETLTQMSRALPADAQSALIGEFAFSNLAGMKDAVVLLCLNAEETIRHEAAQWLLNNAHSITKTALRRLIVMRNWLPESERKLIDSLIKAARIKGVECAQWEAVQPLQSVQVSQMDGVGAQSLMFSVEMGGNQYRVGALLLKQKVGVADAWMTPVISRQEFAKIFRHATKRELFLTVSTDFLHTSVRHNLAECLTKGVPPAVGLLQLAEAIGATEWLPERVDLKALLEQMIASEQRRILNENELETIIQTSDQWGDVPKIVSSWFEESQAVTTFLAKTRIRTQERLERQILTKFCEPNRAVWWEKMAWTALWLRAQQVQEKKLLGLDLNFAVVARELFRGRPLHEVPLMLSVARRTLASGFNF